MVDRRVDVANIDNVIPFRKQDLAIFGKTDMDLFIVIGTDDRQVKDTYDDLLEGLNIEINVKGLTVDNPILTGVNKYFNESIVNTIERIHHNCGSRGWMPSTFDFDKRCAYIINGQKHLKYTDANGIKYLQYCLSIIGNPKYFLMFGINVKKWNGRTKSNNK